MMNSATELLPKLAFLTICEKQASPLVPCGRESDAKDEKEGVSKTSTELRAL